MREAAYFVLIYISVTIVTIEGVKPKSVNLALETVLQFDKKDQSADVEVLNRVQSFLDNIKHVMTSSKSIKRRSNTKDLKFTDFLMEAAEILHSYDDKDLEDFFAVLDDQSRKYHYQGCKFYELLENNDIRTYMSNKLEEAKDSPAKIMKRYLKDLVRVIATENYRRHARLVHLVNSLYDGASDKLDNVVKSLRAYKMRPKDSAMYLDDIVSNALRNVVFDHYSNLNDYARQHLKTELLNYWLSSQYNGDNHKKDLHGSDDGFKEVPDYKSKLRVIDIPSGFKHRNINKNNRIKITGSRGSLSNKNFKRFRSRKNTIDNYKQKITVDFLVLKKTTQDDVVPRHEITSEEDNTKTGKKEYGFTQGLINEDASNSFEIKAPSIRKKSYEAIKPAKSSDDDSDGRDSTNDSGKSKDNNGIGIDLPNEKYIYAQKKNQATQRHKKEKIGHITYDVERRIKMKPYDYSDVDSSDKDSEAAQNSDSNDELTNTKGTVQEDFDGSGIVIGGQNIQDMRYRAESKPRAMKKKRKDTVEHSDDDNRQKSTKKLNDRQKARYKSSNKTKNKKKTTVNDAEEGFFLKTSKVKESKHFPFPSSSEGITIETFENSKGRQKKFSNLRKANEPSTSSINNVHKRIHDLEKQMEDVKERMKLVLPEKTNSTEVDARNNAKGKSEESDKEIDDKEENAQNDTRVETDKTYEIRVYSEAFNKSYPKTTKTVTEGDTTTTLEYETDGETKPGRTTMKITSHETNNNVHPIFRSDLATDGEKTQESNENDTIIISTLKYHETTEILKEHKTTKINILNNTTLNVRTDSIFKTSEETVTALGYVGPKNGKDHVLLTTTGEKSKRTTNAQKDIEKDNEQTISTVVDLTKHLKDSDTIVVNMKDKFNNNVTKMRENTDEINDMGLPNLPFFPNKVDDPLNDVNLELDI